MKSYFKKLLNKKYYTCNQDRKVMNKRKRLFLKRELRKELEKKV